MPYKFETLKFKVGKDKDKRRKLTNIERNEIGNLYKIVSQRKLAKMFNVSRNLIRLYGDKKNLERHLELRKEKGNIYYNSNRHKRYMKTHRGYKKHLYSLKNVSSVFFVLI